MTLADLLAWGTVVAGAVLVALGIRATVYFRHQRQIMGGNWIIDSLYRTTLTITAVSAWLTLARTITLLIGRQPWIGVVSGIAIIWLLLIPRFLEAMFRSHEGR